MKLKLNKYHYYQNPSEPVYPKKKMIELLKAENVKGKRKKFLFGKKENLDIAVTF